MRKGTSLATINKAQICERIASGESVTSIAHSMGYSSHMSISKQLKDDQDYKDALEASHWAKLESVEEDIQNASDMVSVARSRARSQLVQFRAQTEARHIWGKDTIDTATLVQPTFNVIMSGSSPTITIQPDQQGGDAVSGESVKG